MKITWSRAVYSRANRGPFMADTYADYKFAQTNSFELYFNGNKNLKLPEMDMFELGYRSKLTKNIMIDLEAFFHTVTQDYSYFLPDSVSMDIMTSQMNGYFSYHNFALKSIQNGITCNISMVINSNLNFKIFGTLQQTELLSFYPQNFWDNLGALQINDITQFVTDTTTYHTIIKTHYNSANSMDTMVLKDEKHTATPTFYGGADINYSPVKKININTSFYYYSAQTFMHEKNEFLPTDDTYKLYQIKPKVTVDLKISYKFWKENSVFFNARNLFNSDNNEFAFMDKVKGLYLLGLSMNF